MRPDKLLEQVKFQPFQPFRIHLTNGASFEIRHPELIFVTQRAVIVAKPIRGEEVPESIATIDPMHITHVEPLNGARKPSARKPRKR